MISLRRTFIAIAIFLPLALTLSARARAEAPCSVHVVGDPLRPSAAEDTWRDAARAVEHAVNANADFSYGLGLRSRTPTTSSSKRFSTCFAPQGAFNPARQ